MTPTTPEGVIPDALFRKLSQLTLSPPLAIAWAGVAFDGNVPYLEALFLPNTTANLAIANEAPAQYQGFFQVTVVGSADGGIIQEAEIAGKVVQHFAKGTVLTAGAVKIRVPRKPSMTVLPPESGEQRVPVSIPYLSFN